MRRNVFSHARPLRNGRPTRNGIAGKRPKSVRERFSPFGASERNLRLQDVKEKRMRRTGPWDSVDAIFR
jgi:hypothetical protein